MTAPKSQHLGFLFGSGISIPAGLPCMPQITDIVLTGKGIQRHTNGSYVFNLNSIPSHEYVDRIVQFLNRLKTEIDDYFSRNNAPATNYEDIYFVVKQIHDSELRELENPVVQAFIDKIINDIQPILTGQEPRFDLYKLAEESMHYIKDIVLKLLSKQPSDTSYLEPIKDACQDDEFTNVDIFTLNHDILLESFFFQNNVKFIDGFRDEQNGVKYWYPELFDSLNYKTRVFKLHGSINWYRLPTYENNGEDTIGIPRKLDERMTESPEGKISIAVDGRPMFLVGTYNKMLEYTTGLYDDLYNRFYTSLRLLKRLVVCGYGFGDRGINLRLLKWINTSSDRKIIVIHPNPDELRNSAGYVIRRIGEPRIEFIASGIQDISWADVKRQLL